MLCRANDNQAPTTVGREAHTIIIVHAEAWANTFYEIYEGP